MNQNQLSQHCPETICRYFYISGKVSFSPSPPFPFIKAIKVMLMRENKQEKKFNAYCLRKAGLGQYIGETIQKQLIHGKM